MPLLTSSYPEGTEMAKYKHSLIYTRLHHNCKPQWPRFESAWPAHEYICSRKKHVVMLIIHEQCFFFPLNWSVIVLRRTTFFSGINFPVSVIWVHSYREGEYRLYLTKPHPEHPVADPPFLWRGVKVQDRGVINVSVQSACLHDTHTVLTPTTHHFYPFRDSQTNSFFLPTITACHQYLIVFLNVMPVSCQKLSSFKSARQLLVVTVRVWQFWDSYSEEKDNHELNLNKRFHALFK